MLFTKPSQTVLIAESVSINPVVLVFSKMMSDVFSFQTSFPNTCSLGLFITFFFWWLGWAMVLGSFQCRGVLLRLHILGQGPVVLAAGGGRVGYICFYFSSIFRFKCSVFWETADHE